MGSFKHWVTWESWWSHLNNTYWVTDKFSPKIHWSTKVLIHGKTCLLPAVPHWAVRGVFWRVPGPGEEHAGWVWGGAGNQLRLGAGRVTDLGLGGRGTLPAQFVSREIWNSFVSICYLKGMKPSGSSLCGFPQFAETKQTTEGGVKAADNDLPASCLNISILFLLREWCEQTLTPVRFCCPNRRCRDKLHTKTDLIQLRCYSLKIKHLGCHW